MIKLAEASGIVMYEDGSKLYISERPAKWTSVFLFVTGLLTLILLVNGILQLTAFKDDNTSSSAIGFALLGAGILFLLISWRVWLYSKKINAMPLHDLKPIAIFDFQNNQLLNGQQRLLAPIDQVWMSRKMQITSSSPELIVSWANGSLSLVKGNPFSGGMAAIEKALSAKGVRRK